MMTVDELLTEDDEAALVIADADLRAGRTRRLA